MFLKNIYVFYIMVALPLIVPVVAANNQYLSSEFFTLSLLAYCFIHHPLISGFRLVQNKKITTRVFWRNFLPLWNLKYWNFLFLDK